MPSENLNKSLTDFWNAVSASYSEAISTLISQFRDRLQSASQASPSISELISEVRDRMQSAIQARADLIDKLRADLTERLGLNNALADDLSSISNIGKDLVDFFVRDEGQQASALQQRLGASGTDHINLSSDPAVYTGASYANDASAANGLNSPISAISGSQPSSGVDAVANFQYSLDQLRIALQSAPSSQLQAFDAAVTGGAALFNFADATHGGLGVPSNNPATDLLANHTTVQPGITVA